MNTEHGHPDKKPGPEETTLDAVLAGRILPTSPGVLIRLGICTTLLICGALGMLLLASMKKPPAEVLETERAMLVECMRAQAEDVPVTLTGYGQARTLNIVAIAPEIGGTIAKVHPRLEVGELIPSGEVLFAVDVRDYRAVYKETMAMVKQFETSIERLRKQHHTDQERQKTLERTRELAKKNLDRAKTLFENDNVGAATGVEAAELAYNSAADMADQLATAVELYPLRIAEADQARLSAEARAHRAELNVERCQVRAPFDARVKSVTLEAGQYVRPGIAVLTLADDSILEINVPLDSSDARRWLPYLSNSTARTAAWFHKVEPVRCNIRWTEDKDASAWTGTLHRVVGISERTRTLTTAIRITAGAAAARPPAFPLVEGMFCTVEIPGYTLEQVFRLPATAVTFDNQVYLSVSNRLQTVTVTVARREGSAVFVEEGISTGDAVIITRLIDPLEGTLLAEQPGQEIENRP